MHRASQLALIAILAVVFDLTPKRVQAQEFAPFSEFSALADSQLASVQFKWTQVTPTFRNGITFVLSTHGGAFNPNEFSPFYRASYRHLYISDFGWAGFAACSPAETRALIDSLALLPSLTVGGVLDPPGLLSFSILARVSGQPRVFEAIVDTTHGRPLFEKVLRVMANNHDALDLTKGIACAYSMLPPIPPESASSSVEVRFSGMRYDRRADEFISTLRLRNDSPTALAAPVYLVLGVTGNVRPTAYAGQSCRMGPPGRPYLILNGGKSIPSGATISETVRFTNPDHEPIEFSDLNVYFGAGTP